MPQQVVPTIERNDMAGHTTTVTRKGQITIPADVRRALGLAEGDQVTVEQQGETAVLRRAQSVTSRTAGILASYRRVPAARPEEERAAFEEGVATEVAHEG